ncbi:lysophospholipid acyltransferase family protein [Spongiibacter sp. KMU-158]|uniref:Lysophospholipid acyltransferase family protein n=1 Tax=Spongiibacter pelagi TaxID=2760804 RepID=A0A927GVM2_9GAMM|nr:lysophospholipid acyltransferase family protein [Spongiibacter pelagi]MBD2858032.1 lysophospholipid acyltransferase family protein [Spongiibacter pelagi]
MTTTPPARVDYMQRKTVCNHPLILKFLQLSMLGVFRLRGWRFDTELPEQRKYVMIVAPHTSNWDFFLLVGFGASLKRQVRFMIKHTFFWGPVGVLFRWLGGIAVERSSSHNFVDHMAEQFKKTDDMVLIITPEGTRRKVDSWKGGFYHIANGAGVPIMPVYLDYGRKTVGFGEAFIPSGNFEQDLPKILETYSTVRACHPEMDGSKFLLDQAKVAV